MAETMADTKEFKVRIEYDKNCRPWPWYWTVSDGVGCGKVGLAMTRRGAKRDAGRAARRLLKEQPKRAIETYTIEVEVPR